MSASDKPPRTMKSDLLDLVKILLALGVIALALELISCQPSTELQTTQEIR